MPFVFPPHVQLGQVEERAMVVGAAAMQRWRRLLLKVYLQLHTTLMEGLLLHATHRVKKVDVLEVSCQHPRRRRGANQYARWETCQDCMARLSYSTVKKKSLKPPADEAAKAPLSSPPAFSSPAQPLSQQQVQQQQQQALSLIKGEMLGELTMLRAEISEQMKLALQLSRQDTEQVRRALYEIELLKQQSVPSAAAPMPAAAAAPSARPLDNGREEISSDSDCQMTS